MTTVKKSFCENCSHCEICSVKEEYNRVCCMIENSIVAVGYIDKYRISVECPHYSQRFGTVRTSYELGTNAAAIDYNGVLGYTAAWNNVHTEISGIADGITATAATAVAAGERAYSDAEVFTDTIATLESAIGEN